ncbi:MAG TPA: alpha/beta fold hydrolase [Streptosporangiaceae bacterium]|nr:alpha/beta fold hydrolase [Streptosporangiaceae bacterium]
MDLPTNDYDVDAEGGTLRVIAFGAGPLPVLAVHGITASAMCWQAVARALPPDCTLYAVDLRGRGHSAALPGPFGFDAHAADLRQTVAALGLECPALIGHSLGAYVALLAADAHPGIFGSLVLVDGGLPLPVPADADLDALMMASLGPALRRLAETYPTADAYLDFWRAHPALTHWTSDVEDYVRYDLTGEPGALRSRANPDAVRADSRELLTGTERISAALYRLSRPTPVLRAPAGMFGHPPGLLPDELVSHWQRQVLQLQVTTLPETNHYSILFSPRTADIAAQLYCAAGWGNRLGHDEQ